MAEPSLIEIFDLCIERLAAGETVEDCLKDYPDSADELRGMLETGALIFQAQADTDDEQQAQAHTRSRIEEALQTDFAPRKGKNSMFTLRRSVIWVGGAAAAIFAFTFGFAFALTPPTQQINIVADSTLPDFDGDGLSNERESQYGTDPNLSDSDNDSIIDGDEVYVWATNPLLRDSDYDGWSDGDEINTRGTNPNKSDLITVTPPSNQDDSFILTATQYVLEVTQTAYMEARATVRAQPDPRTTTDALILTATQFVKEITQTAEVAMTATSMAIMPLQPMGTPTPMPTLGPLGTSVPDTAITGDIVATSAAGYLPMTPTFAPPSSSTTKDKDGTTSSDDKPLLVEPERDRTETDTDEYAGEGRTVSDGVLAVESGGAGAPEAPVMPADVLAAPTIMASYSTEGSALNATIVLSQEQLNPMKAGEIDDNAEWDTYMEFRHNFINTYGAYSVIDMDVSGRRIIKVVDATGKPILGARVTVTAPNFSVETLTYATGMTLFFPNADESTKRRDEFQIIVSYDQYQAYYTLNLRKVGDLVEIQMPIVIVRGTNVDTADVFLTATAASQNAADAAQNATQAARNAADAAQNATFAAENAADAARNATLAAQNAPSNEITPLPADAYPATLMPTPTPAYRVGNK